MPTNPPSEHYAWPEPPPTGRIDIHSHLLPGLDDGCRDIAESLLCVRQLMEQGFVGTVCTPHVWPSEFPNNTAANIRRWTAELQCNLTAAGLDYRVWPGGELRIDHRTLQWLEHDEVPTLAGSRCVLVDFWVDRWPDWVEPTFRALMARGFQPILAHPERIKWNDELLVRLQEARSWGLWFQCNANSYAGFEGYAPQFISHALLDAGHYDILALDMHRPNTLATRLQGVRQLGETLGQETLDRLTVEAPRRLLFGADARGPRSA